MADERIELTDLDVIARYSLAVRTATADRDELIATLRSDLEWLQGLRPARGRAAVTAASAPATPPTPARAQSTPARKTAKPAAAKKAAAKKAAKKAPAKKGAPRR